MNRIVIRRKLKRLYKLALDFSKIYEKYGCKSEFLLFKETMMTEENDEKIIIDLLDKIKKINILYENLVLEYLMIQGNGDYNCTKSSINSVMKTAELEDFKKKNEDIVNSSSNHYTDLESDEMSYLLQLSLRGRNILNIIKSGLKGLPDNQELLACYNQEKKRFNALHDYRGVLRDQKIVILKKYKKECLEDLMSELCTINILYKNLLIKYLNFIQNITIPLSKVEDNIKRNKVLNWKELGESILYFDEQKNCSFSSEELKYLCSLCLKGKCIVQMIYEQKLAYGNEYLNYDYQDELKKFHQLLNFHNTLQNDYMLKKHISFFRLEHKISTLNKILKSSNISDNFVAFKDQIKDKLGIANDRNEGIFIKAQNNKLKKLTNINILSANSEFKIKSIDR